MRQKECLVRFLSLGDLFALRGQLNCLSWSRYNSGFLSTVRGIGGACMPPPSGCSGPGMVRWGKHQAHPREQSLANSGQLGNIRESLCRLGRGGAKLQANTRQDRFHFPGLDRE